MKVLVACEMSGRVRDAFIRVGHEAMSCDLLPSLTEGPHYIGDVLDILYDGWDLMIAHPPCTYLSKAGARWLHPKTGLNLQRFADGKDAEQFFRMLLNAPIPRIAIENPTPLRIFGLPTHTQVIQPYEFGHSFSKRTLLWLKNLPLLQATNMVREYVPYLPSNTGGKRRGQSYSFGAVHTQMEASLTFQGVADAMAEQWGSLPRHTTYGGEEHGR